MLHVLVGSDDHDLDAIDAAARSTSRSFNDWVVPKVACDGDKAVLFFQSKGLFTALAEIASTPVPSHFGDQPVYRANLRNIEAISRPLPLDSVAAAAPEWGWTRQRVKRGTTPPPEVARKLEQIIGQHEPQPAPAPGPVALASQILTEAGPLPGVARSGRVGNRIAVNDEPFICVHRARKDGTANIQLWPDAMSVRGPLPADAKPAPAPDPRDPNPNYTSFELSIVSAVTFCADALRRAVGEPRAEPTADRNYLDEQVARLLLRGSVERPPPRENPALSASLQRTEFVRDPQVKAWVLQEAEGRCELCANPAPFIAAGRPYLEVHHVRPLAEGGPDTVENAVALCPNCHRRLHHGHDADVQREQLYANVPRLQRSRSVFFMERE